MNQYERDDALVAVSAHLCRAFICLCRLNRLAEDTRGVCVMPAEPVELDRWRARIRNLGALDGGSDVTRTVTELSHYRVGDEVSGSTGAEGLTTELTACGRLVDSLNRGLMALVRDGCGSTGSFQSSAVYETQCILECAEEMVERVSDSLANVYTPATDA